MIERTLTVRTGVERAFRAWVEHIDLWWPRNHRISGETDTTMVLEAGVGGRFFERTATGELDYGRVTDWDPPHHLGYDFYLGSSRDVPTHVDVRFAADGDSTRVHIVHRPAAVPLERWQSTSKGYRRAWDHLCTVFPAYIQENP